MSKDYVVPKKIKNCIQRLAIDYETQNKVELFRILNICEAKIIDTYVDMDDCYEHTLNISLPSEIFKKYLPLSVQENLGKQLKRDINKALSIRGEYVGQVNFDLNDKLINSSIALEKSERNALKELKFWKPDYLRVFVSHSVRDYETAKELKDYMENHWFSCFVAHKDIKVTQKWRKEIIKALNSMEVFTILISQKCKESDYVNQEVGFALSRNIPIIPVKLDDNDPPGFINEIQAITLNKKEEKTFNEIVESIKDKFPKHISIKKKALNDFFDSQSTTYQFAQKAFMNLIEFKFQFNDLEIDQIVKAITREKLNTKGYYGKTNQLKILLENENYAKLIHDKILAQHTKKKYSLKSSNGDYKIINNDEIHEDKIKYEELSF